MGGFWRAGLLLRPLGMPLCAGVRMRGGGDFWTQRFDCVVERHEVDAIAQITARSIHPKTHYRTSPFIGLRIRELLKMRR